MLPILPNPNIQARAEILILESGQALVRSHQGDHTTEKFVTAEDLQAAFALQEIDTGWFPPGVMRCGQNAGGPWFVYSAPPQRLDLILDDSGVPVEKIPVPRTVLIGANGRYYMLALKEDHFGKDSQVWQAPFPNLYTSGRICWGSNTPPGINAGLARQIWELFFATPFNNHLANAKSAQYPDDVRQQLRAVAGKRRYPLDDLNPPGYQSSIDRVTNDILEGSYVS